MIILRNKVFSIFEEDLGNIKVDNKIYLKKVEPVKFAKWLGKNINSIGIAQSNYSFYDIISSNKNIGSIEIEKTKENKLEIIIWNKSNYSDINKSLKYLINILKKTNNSGILVEVIGENEPEILKNINYTEDSKSYKDVSIYIIK